MRRRNLWRLDTTAVQKVTGEPYMTRSEAFPVYVRSWLDNPETCYAEQGAMSVRFPIPQPGVDWPFQDFIETGFEPTSRLMAQWRAAMTGSPDGLPLEIFELPPTVLDEVLLNAQHTDEFTEHKVRVQQAGLAARSAEPTTLPTWDIPASTWGVSSCELLSEIQRHMLEATVDGGLTWASGLWTAGEVRGFLNLRIQRFLIETGLLRKEATVPVVVGQDSAPLPTDLLEIRTVDFLDASGVYHNLSKLDFDQADWSSPDWESDTQVPTGYMEEPLPGLTIELFPSPSEAGTLVIRYVPLPLQVSATCMPLPIPRMFTWAVKWGTIADMLMKEGEANDPARASAAEAQFQMGVNMAKLLLGAEV